MDSYLYEQMEQYDLQKIEDGFTNIFPGYHLDAEQLFSLLLQGKAGSAVKLLLQAVSEGMKGEFSGIRSVLLTILIIGIVSALFSVFSDIFAGHQVPQTGFYFLYLFLIAVLTRAFVYVSEITVTIMGNMVLFVKLFIPAWLLAVGTASGGVTATVYYQIMMLTVYVAESFLLTVVLPFIYSYVVLALLNGIWSEERLALLLDLLKKGVETVLKIVMGVITGLSLVQAVIAPAVDGLKLSALKRAVSVVPGIGNAAEGVAELMMGSAVLIKNSLGVLLLLLLLLACSLPLCKILAVAGVVKLGAAVTGIISDKRIAGCTDRVGEGCFLLLRCVFTTVAMFLIVIAVVAYGVR